jgi:energy coupling factor transporter S component ThiW
VVGGIVLGPWWALASAVVASAIRYQIGTGTILAFPGSMFGALAVGFTAGMLPKKRRLFAAAAEPLATGFLGAWVSSLIMTYTGKEAMFALLSSAFFISSAPGAIIGFLSLATVGMAVKRGAARVLGGKE